MSISKPEDVSDHGHDSERATVVAASVEPCFRVARAKPQHSVKVLTRRVVQRVLEHLELLHEAEVVEVGRHL